MPKTPKRQPLDLSRVPPIPRDLIGHFAKGPVTALAVEEASAAFKRALIEAALGAGLTHHLRYETGADRPPTATNHRNGATPKTVLTGQGPVAISTPPDRRWRAATLCP